MPAGENLWDEVALLQYTGGTTGLPKAAMLTHGCVMAAMSQGQAWTTPYTTPGTEKVVCVLPLFHIYALSGIMLGAVRNGNQLILYPRPDIDMIVTDLAKKKPTFLPGVPTLYTAIIKHPKAQGLDLKSLKICMSGGAPLPVEVQQSFEKLTGATLIEGYGLTETSPTGAICPVDKSVRRVGSCGLPMPGTIIEIRDMENNDRVLPAGKENVGEVCIIGPQVMKGYWKKPDETEQVLFSHPASNWKGLRTGDMGYMDDDGWLYLVDRSKDLIISSGYNVYPRMIEEAIYEHPAVDECIVIGIPDPYRQEAPKVFVKLKPGASLTFDELKKHLATASASTRCRWRSRSAPSCPRRRSASSPRRNSRKRSAPRPKPRRRDPDMAGRRVFLLGGAGLVLGGCFDRPCHERNPAQKAFLDGLQALAKPALASNNPLAVEEAAKQSVALAEKVGAFPDWCGTLRTIEGNAQKVAVTIEIGPQVSLYAFNDWTLAFAGSVTDLFSTRSRQTPPPGLSEVGHRGAKNPAAR